MTKIHKISREDFNTAIEKGFYIVQEDRGNGIYHVEYIDAALYTHYFDVQVIESKYRQSV